MLTKFIQPADLQEKYQEIPKNDENKFLNIFL